MKSIPIFGTEANVPTTIGNLTYSLTQVFDEPGMGVALRYEADETKGDIYLYNHGLAMIPDDIQSPEVQEVFRQECAKLIRLSELGYYKDLQMLTTDIWPTLDDPSLPMYYIAGFRYRHGSGVGDATERVYTSHLALRIDGGFFIKVRYTYPDCTDSAEIDKKIAYFGLFLFGLYDKLRLA